MARRFFEKSVQIWDAVDWFKESITYAKFQALGDVLPVGARGLHKDDRDRILNTLIESWREIFSPKRSPTLRKELSIKLKKVGEAALELYELLEGDSPPSFESTISECWESSDHLILNNMQLRLAPDGSLEGEWADFDALKRQIFALVAAVDLAQGGDGMRFDPYAPKDPRRHEIAAALTDAWTTVHLLSGANLEDSVPSGTNGGFRWCYEMLGDLGDMHPVRPTSPAKASEAPKEKDYEHRARAAFERLQKSRERMLTHVANVEEEDGFSFAAFETKSWTYDSVCKAISSYVNDIRSGQHEDFPAADCEWTQLNLSSKLGFTFIEFGAGLSWREEIIDAELPADLLPAFEETFPRK